MLFYGLVDYIKMKYGRQIILLIFLSIYFIILPNFYSYTEPKDMVRSGMFCGNYIFEYFEPYWFVGVALILFAHLVYCFLLNRKLKSA